MIGHIELIGSCISSKRHTCDALATCSLVGTTGTGLEARNRSRLGLVKIVSQRGKSRSTASVLPGSGRVTGAGSGSASGNTVVVMGRGLGGAWSILLMVTSVVWK